MTYWNFRNRNRRKWKALRRRNTNVLRWLVGTIEGKFVRHASLCRITPQADSQIEKSKQRKIVERQMPLVVMAPDAQSPAFTDSIKRVRKPQNDGQKTDRQKKKDQLCENEREKQRQQQEDQVNQHRSKELKQSHSKKDEFLHTSEEIVKNAGQNATVPLDDTKNNWVREGNSAAETQPKSKSRNEKEKSKRKLQLPDKEEEKIDNILLSNPEIVSTSFGKSIPMSELSVDVTTNNGKLHTNETTTSLTKCSVDSGVDVASSSTPFSPTAFDAPNVEEFVEKVQNSFQNVLSINGDTENYKFNAVTPMEPCKRVIRRRAGLGLLPQDVEYCLYMMKMYGDNYEEMIKDKRNIYMDDENTIARKIRIFRESVHYREYVASRSVTPQAIQQSSSAASVS